MKAISEEGRGILIPEEEVGGARNGQVVGVEIMRPPEEGRRAVGRIVEVLGLPDDPGIDLRTIVRKYDLREEFPPDVLHEAAAIPAEVPREEIGRRVVEAVALHWILGRDPHSVPAPRMPLVGLVERTHGPAEDVRAARETIGGTGRQPLFVGINHVNYDHFRLAVTKQPHRE